MGSRSETSLPAAGGELRGRAWRRARGQKQQAVTPRLRVNSGLSAPAFRSFLDPLGAVQGWKGFLCR